MKGTDEKIEEMVKFLNDNDGNYDYKIEQGDFELDNDDTITYNVVLKPCIRYIDIKFTVNKK